MAAVSVFCFAALDHIAGTVRMKSIGVSFTTLADNRSFKMENRCLYKYER
jgi:hypothetical protein